jgi:hypothetical protein
LTRYIIYGNVIKGGDDMDNLSDKQKEIQEDLINLINEERHITPFEEYPEIEKRVKEKLDAFILKWGK